MLAGRNVFRAELRTAAERNCAAGMISQQVKSGKAGDCRLAQFLIYLKIENMTNAEFTY